MDECTNLARSLHHHLDRSPLTHATPRALGANSVEVEAVGARTHRPLVGRSVALSERNRRTSAFSHSHFQLCRERRECHMCGERASERVRQALIRLPVSQSVLGGETGLSCRSAGVGQAEEFKAFFRLNSWHVRPKSEHLNQLGINFIQLSLSSSSPMGSDYLYIATV